MKFSALSSLGGVAVLALTLLDTVNAFPWGHSDHTLTKRAVYSGVNKACASGYYATGPVIAKQGKLCLPCTTQDRLAVTCTETKILSCKSPSYLTQYNGEDACLHRCPFGTFPDDKKRICAACTTKDKNAASCSATAILTCQTGKFLSAGKCLNACPAKSYPDTNTKSCKACSDPAATKCSATSATECNSTSFLSAAGKCVKTCPTGTFGATTPSRACIDCGDGVATCNPVTGQAITCEKRADGINTAFDSATKKCLPVCSGPNFLDSASGSCKACELGATACKSATESTNCGTFGGVEFFLEGSRCVKTCAVGSFGASGVCKTCGDGITECTADGTPKACGTKADKTALYLVNNACESSCPTATFADVSAHKCLNCPTGVSSCTSPTNHVSCSAPLFLENGSCVTACKAAGAYGLNGVCVSCGEGITSCSSTGIPETCGTKADLTQLFFTGTECATACGEGKFPQISDHSCQTCPEGTLTCESATKALSCGKNAQNVQFYLQGDSCVTECTTAGTFAQGDRCVDCGDGVATCDPLTGQAKTCEKKADETQTFFDAATNQCTTKCSGATFGDISTESCAACEAGATGCNSATESTSCGNVGETPFFLEGSRCVEACKQGFYGVENRCTACGDGITSCDASGTPKTCGTKADTTESFFTGTGCESSCATGTYPKLSSHSCESCGDGISSCAADGAPLTCGTKADQTVLFFDPTKSECTETCPSGYSGINNLCKKCPDFATSCTSPTFAEICGANNQGSATFAQAGSCVETCTTGNYGKDGRCVSCGDGVTECLADGTPYSCGKKSDGTQLVLDQTAQQCIPATECEARVGFSPQSGRCDACSTSFSNSIDCSATAAITCIDGYEVQNGQCTPKLTPGAYSKYSAEFVAQAYRTQVIGYELPLQICISFVRQDPDYVASRDGAFLYGQGSYKTCYRVTRVTKPFQASFPSQQFEYFTTALAGTCAENARYNTGNVACEDFTYA